MYGIINIFNNAFNTFLLTGYFSVGNIFMNKKPVSLTGIDLKLNVRQPGAYITGSGRYPLVV